MADIADRANDYAQEGLSRSIAQYRADIPQGVAGHCVECDEHFPRLVDGKCVPCREIDEKRL